MIDKQVRKKIIVAIIIFVAVSLVFILVALFTPKNGPETLADPLADQNAYIDPDSGELVLNPEGKAPEGEENQVVVLGLSKLLDAGLSSPQYENTVKAGFDAYINEQNKNSKKINQISLVVNTISPRINQTTGGKQLLADVRINKKDTLKLTISYSGVIAATLGLYNPTTNTTFTFDPRDELDEED